MRLMREIRCLLPSGSLGGGLQPTNSWAGTSVSSGAGPFYVISAIVEGPVDSSTGYVCNIKAIDDLLRSEVASRIFDWKSEISNPLGATASKVRDAFLHIKSRPPAAVALSELWLRISPFTRFGVFDGEASMIRLTQSFEFSASHRLFRAELSDAENLRLFGKCSNPAGHGHNYVVEVTVRGAPSEEAGTVTDIGALDLAVKARVIDDFDHKNLNVECREFAKLNPTVENIAVVIWNRLTGQLGKCELVNVRVWETPKTYAEYDGRE